MRSVLRWLGVVGLFVGLAVAHTWPLATHAATHAQGGSDPRTMMWSLFDLSRNLVGDPLHLMDGSAFYPFRDTLAVVDHQIGNALLAAPLVLGGADPVLVYNLVFLATFVLSGLFTCLLVRRLGGSTAAGVVAGAAFAFATARIYTLPHLHLLATQWLPLALLTLHRYLERATPARWLALAGSMLLLAFSSWQVAVIGAMAIAVVTLWTIVGDPRRAGGRVLGLALVGILCAGALLPLARVYGEVAARWPPAGGEGPGIEVMLRNSLDLERLVAMPERSRVPYAAALARQGPSVFPGVVTVLLALPALGLLWRARRRGSSSARGAAWLRRAWWSAALLAGAIVAAALAGGADSGVVAWLRPLAPVALFGCVAAAASLWLARRVGAGDRAVAPVITYAALAGAGLFLALGPRVLVGDVDVGSGLWRLDLLPIPLLMRAPIRFSLLLALGASVLVGLGLARVLEGRSRRARAALVVALLALLNVDLAFTMPELDPAPDPSGVDDWLAESSEEGAVLEFPLFVLDGNYWALYASQALYERRNVEGLGYLRPPELRRIRLLPDFGQLQIELLWEHFHPRFVLLRGDMYPPAALARVETRIDALGRALRLRARSGPDRLYELFDAGNGPRIYRRWPLAEILESDGFLRFRGGLTEGRADTVGSITVLLNGHVLTELRGPATEGRRAEVVAIERQHLVPGINTFELRAGYRFADGAEPNPVGATGVEVRADVEVVAEEERSRIVVNAVPFTAEGGALLALLDPGSAEVTATASFDLAEEGAAGEMARFVDGIPGGAVVAIAIPGSAVALPPAAAAALRRLGVEVADGSVGGARAAVGVVGAVPGTALQSAGAATAHLTVGRPEGRRVRLRSLALR